MRFDGDLFYYKDENEYEQFIQFIHPITKIDTVGTLGNECRVYTDHAEYIAVWLKDVNRIAVNTIRGPENRWEDD